MRNSTSYPSSRAHFGRRCKRSTVCTCKKNACAPTFSKVLGKSTDKSPVQLLKACSPIVLRLEADRAESDFCLRKKQIFRFVRCRRQTPLVSAMRNPKKHSRLSPATKTEIQRFEVGTTRKGILTDSRKVRHSPLYKSYLFNAMQS